MTRTDLIARLAAAHPELPAKDIDLAVRAILDAMGDSIARGERIEIRGFGSFGLNLRRSRQARNPKTGVAVLVQPKYCPHFKAGKELRERVDANK